jgi:16S rRNA (cytosine1402-N4)-methyltransferase
MGRLNQDIGGRAKQAEADKAQTYHVPVMLQEAVDALAIKRDGVYVDCTFGGGGHARAILSQLGPEGRLIAFDQDEDAKANLPQDGRLTFVPHNFRHLSRFLRLHQIVQVDGVLADLGVSSHQFDEPERGFSIRFDAPLDMRMDQSAELTAAAFLQQSTPESLQLVFQEYGEVTNSRTLAHLLCEQVRRAPIQTIAALKASIAPVVKGNPNKYFAQVFQALRMAVNDETGALKDLLEQAAAVIKPGGRLAIITFHSVEDRIVKQFLKLGVEGSSEADPVFGTRKEAPFEPVTRKPIEPGIEEVRRNPRSRSARLRVGVRMDNSR